MDMLKKLLDKIKIDSSHTELGFSIMHSLYDRVSAKEVMHSEIIAELLSVNTNLLQTFLEEIGISKENLPKIEEEQFNNANDLEIICESSIEGQRRIDILITWDKKAVIVENKLNNASDQPNQLSDYYNAKIKEGFDVLKVIYMPLYNIHTAKEETGSVPKEKITTIHLKKLIEWLEKSIKLLPNQSDEWIACKSYLSLLKYINIKNQNYMNAQEILSELTQQGQIQKLGTILSITLKDWHNAVFNPILEKVKASFKEELKSEINSNGLLMYFADYKYWIDVRVRFLTEHIDLYVVDKETGKDIPAYLYRRDFCYDEHENTYRYFKKNKTYKFPTEDKNADLINDIIDLLKTSKN